MYLGVYEVIVEIEAMFTYDMILPRGSLQRMNGRGPSNQPWSRDPPVQTSFLKGKIYTLTVAFKAFRNRVLTEVKCLQSVFLLESHKI